MWNLKQQLAKKIFFEISLVLFWYNVCLNNSQTYYLCQSLLSAHKQATDSWKPISKLCFVRAAVLLQSLTKVISHFYLIQNWGSLSKETGLHYSKKTTTTKKQNCRSSKSPLYHMHNFPASRIIVCFSASIYLFRLWLMSGRCENLNQMLIM